MRKLLWTGVAAIAVVATIFLWRLSPQWFWVGWEIVAGAMLSVGCIGEWILISREKPKTPEEELKHRREKVCTILVTAGVALEFLALFHTIPEGIKLERDIVAIEQKNLILRTNLVALEEKLQPRTISIEQRKRFLQIMADRPKGPARVMCLSATAESHVFAEQLRDLLDDAGYKTTNGVQIESFGTGYYRVPIGDTEPIGDLAIIVYGEPKNFAWPGATFEWKGSQVYSHFSTNDLREVPFIIDMGLSQIGFKVNLEGNREVLHPNEWAILVHEQQRR
jgi:hypothetical protein